MYLNACKADAPVSALLVWILLHSLAPRTRMVYLRPPCATYWCVIGALHPSWISTCTNHRRMCSCESWHELNSHRRCRTPTDTRDRSFQSSRTSSCEICPSEHRDISLMRIVDRNRKRSICIVHVQFQLLRAVFDSLRCHLSTSSCAFSRLASRWTPMHTNHRCSGFCCGHLCEV